MTEEFKRLFDKGIKETKAKELAKRLGYLEGYYGSLGYDIADDVKWYFKEINNTLGTDEWPESVRESFTIGYNTGYMDS